MWRTPDNLETDARQAAHILSSPDLFREAARNMLRDWTKAAEHNLTDTTGNRLSWIGQATCCHLSNIPEAATRAAWWTLTTAEQTVANRVAAEVIAEWEHTHFAEPDLFTFDA